MFQLNLNTIKKSFGLLIVLLGMQGSLLMGQTSVDINGDMENWTNGFFSGIPYDSIVCWDTPQRLGTALGVPDTVVFQESSNVASGSFAAKLVTRDVIIAGILPATVPGAISTGNFFVNLFTAEFGVMGSKPISCSPFALTGMADYIPAGTDTAAVNVLLLLGTDTIGGGTLDLFATSGYESFTVPIFNFAPIPPTSIQITITSSKDAGQDGSTLYIDDLQLLCPDACPAPVNLTATPTASSALLSWDPVASALGYTVYGREAGTSRVGRRNVAANSINIGILSPSTTYEWTVQAICAAEESALAGMNTFTTPSIRASADFSVYPNPAVDQLNINLYSEKEEIISLYSITGMQLRTLRTIPGQTAYSMDLRDLSEGLYIVQYGEGELVTSEMIEIVR